MRASPAFEVSLHRFGAWRVAVTLLAARGLAAIAAWLITHERPIGMATTAAAVIAAGVSVRWAVLLARLPAVSLRWDGQRWHLGAWSALSGEATCGTLGVAIDLGPWMPLRFTPAGLAHRAPTVWLPAQRRGLEAQWHALRCAVHSQRPAPDADPAAGH